MAAVWRKILADECRLLTFRRLQLEPALFNAYLAFGLGFTWLCGMGRYWDNPRADLWQTLGLGSVAYIFVMAAILWMIILPLRPRHWSYRNVLLFVSLTAPPAILYAIPVERMMSLPAAQQVNVWFLALVASWRIALLVKFLVAVARLPGLCVLVATLLPLTLIVTLLSLLNLEHVVFKIMAGLTEDERSGNDAAYFILLVITYFSVMASPVLFALYLWLIYRRRKRVGRADGN